MARRTLHWCRRHGVASYSVPLYQFPASRCEQESELAMISLYRWQPGQTHGTWVDLPELPPNGCKVAEGEVWWLDLDDPSEEEEALVFQSFLPIHALSLEDIRRPRTQPDSPPHC